MPPCCHAAMLPCCHTAAPSRQKGARRDAHPERFLPTRFAARSAKPSSWNHVRMRPPAAVGRVTCCREREGLGVVYHLPGVSACEDYTLCLGGSSELPSLSRVVPPRPEMHGTDLPGRMLCRVR